MTDDEWVKLLAPDVPWQKCYPRVAELVRVELATGHTYGTTQLAHRLWPLPIPNSEAWTTYYSDRRKRLLHALIVLTKHQLADCVERGQDRRMYGSNKQPYIWRQPKPIIVNCPHCGKTINKGNQP